MPKTGVQLSYQRFLGDSASGIVLLLFIMSSLYFKFPLLGYVSPVEINDVPEKFLLAVSVLMVLLVSPLGLLINSISYILLGRYEKSAVNFFLNRQKFGIKNALANAFFHKWSNFYDISEKGYDEKPIGWYGYFEVINVMTGLYFKELSQSKAHLMGIAQFARSFALISLFVLLNLFFNFFFSARPVSPSELLFFTLILLTLISVFLYTVGFLAAYSTVKIFSGAYLMIISENPKMSGKESLSTDQVIEKLKDVHIKESKRKCIN